MRQADSSVKVKRWVIWSGWTPRQTTSSPIAWAAHFTPLDAALRLQGRVWLRPTTRFAGFSSHVPRPLATWQLRPSITAYRPSSNFAISQGTLTGNPSFRALLNVAPQCGLSAAVRRAGLAPHSPTVHWGALNRLGPIFDERLPPVIQV
jgi:hypothetical protein